jgi:hypothetical protein
MNQKWFNTGVDWSRHPEKGVNIGNMMCVKLIPFLSTFGGVLTYEIQSKYGKFGNQSESTYIRLFVVWKYEVHKEIRACAHLIEYDEHDRWNEIKLEEYYQRYANQLCTYIGSIKDTWLIDDSTVLLTELDLDFTQRNGVLNITISEGVEDDHTKRPIWIDSEK